MPGDEKKVEGSHKETEGEAQPLRRVRTPKTPPVAPGPPKPERIVWFKCRATPGCEGNQAAVVFTKGISGQDSTTRYRCLTCKGSFHVRC
jgi:hypothetical protein